MGAANALVALVVHPSSCTPALLPPLLAPPLGDPRTAELRLRLLLHLLGGNAQLSPAELELSRPSTALSRPGTSAGGLPSALARPLTALVHSGSTLAFRPGTAIGSGSRPATALQPAAGQLAPVPPTFALLGRPLQGGGAHAVAAAGTSADAVLCVCGEGLRAADACVRQAAVELLMEADAVLGCGPTVEAWLAKEPPLPVALHADLEARLRAARWVAS